MLRLFFIISIVTQLTLVASAQTATPQPSVRPTQSIFPYTIMGLQSRSYLGGTIHIRSRDNTNPKFTRYYVDYASDDLTITAMMNVPVGEGPFPVVIMLHGYYDRSTYWSGLGTWQEAEYLSERGYLTLAPDFRSWGESDTGINFFATGLVIDTLNLVSSLPSLQQADLSRVGIWGHSMGGGVATKALVVDPRIRAGVLYAPNSAVDADLIDRWGLGCLPRQSQAAGDKCNPAEVILNTLPQSIISEYLNVADDPALLQHIAPIYHLDDVTAPIQIHIGTADGASLVQTPPEWSEKLYLTLTSAGKEAEFHTYADQGHFLNGQSWVTMMQRTLRFFETHLSD